LADFLTIAIQNPSAASGSVDTRLNRPDFVGVGGTSPAVQTPLRGQEIEMALVAMPARLTDRELTFLDLAEAASTKGAPKTMDYYLLRKAARASTRSWSRTG
jgi:hypothetical protein